MPKSIKYIVYVVACALVFLFIAKTFSASSKGPVVASAFEWEKPVSVYFVESAQAEDSSCVASAQVQRIVPNAETLGPSALAALIEGPKGQEADKYFSAINPKTLIQKFEITNGVASVDFSSDLGQGVAGSCNVVAIRSQIENTLLALPDIDKVVISINGETIGILEP